MRINTVFEPKREDDWLWGFDYTIWSQLLMKEEWMHLTHFFLPLVSEMRKWHDLPLYFELHLACIYVFYLALKLHRDMINLQLHTVSLVCTSGGSSIIIVILPVRHQPVQFSLVAQSCLTLRDPMNCSTPGLPVHHQLQEFTPNSCASSQWCHPAISSSVVPFSSCPQSLPASESFPMSQLFAWGGQSIGVSASA